MISTVWPLPIGTALRLFLSPPAGAVRWRILRKGTDSFTGPDDPSAFVAYEGDDKVVLDTASLRNDVMAFYRPYYWISGAWVDGGQTASGTPSAAFTDGSTDVLGVVRQRLENGLQHEVAAGTLHNDLGYIQVFSAPPQLSDDLRFPLVIVEMGPERPAERAIGEEIADDEFDTDTATWAASEGWLADVTLQIVAWSINPDERNELRNALRRIVVGNLSVFDDAGMVHIDFAMDNGDLVNGEFAAPVYQVLGTLTCQAPVVVRSAVGSIADVETSISEP